MNDNGNSFKKTIDKTNINNKYTYIYIYIY